MRNGRSPVTLYSGSSTIPHGISASWSASVLRARPSKRRLRSRAAASSASAAAARVLAATAASAALEQSAALSICTSAADQAAASSARIASAAASCCTSPCKRQSHGLPPAFRSSAACQLARCLWKRARFSMTYVQSWQSHSPGLRSRTHAHLLSQNCRQPPRRFVRASSRAANCEARKMAKRRRSDPRCARRSCMS
jgi:hypothetical protein